MNEAEIEHGYADTRNWCYNDIIDWSFLKEQVECCADCMERYDTNRARQTRSGVA